MNSLKRSMDVVMSPLLGIGSGRKNLLAMEYGWLSALFALALAAGIAVVSFRGSSATF